MPSIATIIDPTASFVASLLPGEIIVSPSRKERPFFGKDSFTKLIYLDECAQLMMGRIITLDISFLTKRQIILDGATQKDE